jgi:hypothetical protein
VRAGSRQPLPGQYQQHGVWKKAFSLAENATTLATVMKQAGYSTNYRQVAPCPARATAAETRSAVRPATAADSRIWLAANALS